MFPVFARMQLFVFTRMQFASPLLPPCVHAARSIVISINKIPWTRIATILNTTLASQNEPCLCDISRPAPGGIIFMVPAPTHHLSPRLYRTMALTELSDLFALLPDGYIR